MNITTTSLGRDVFSAVNGQHTLLAINLWSHFEPILKLKYADVNDWIAKLQQRENGVVLILDQPVAILEVDIFSGHKGKISQLSWYTLQSNLVNEIARNGIEISFLNGCVEAQYEEIFLERRFIRIGKEQYNGNSKLQNIKSESTVPTSDSSTSESSVGADTNSDTNTKPEPATELHECVELGVSNTNESDADINSTATDKLNPNGKKQKPRGAKGRFSRKQKQPVLST